MATTKINVGTLNKADRKKLATKILALRKKNVAWDGENGICAQLGISGAPVGRTLLREVGQAQLIKPTYDHKAAANKRSAAKPVAKKSRKPAAKKTAKPAPVKVATNPVVTELGSPDA